ncbi:hypothetical protein C8D92_10249 [Tamilnaduibacter salinus]|uniref:MOSC domain-containing protein n=1 Tax=Tamilnaduibacter salinus TaxID=1484056 RepID=A0A2U1CYZ2_9GAMM|nr:MOSC N-terminal beta barrel domain-containing protein [Tamilnaduibacter salinus]PVY78015.1 hypothetical protein C8D92_10249 [Tamilnaduibacter salinus]
MQALTVTQLYRYPVKSLSGNPVDTLTLDDFGPAGDRRWMMVDEAGQFITQRSEPRLALVRASLAGERGDAVCLMWPDQPDGLVVHAGPKRKSVTVWHDTVEGRVGDGDASRALSEWLGRSVELVWMPAETRRGVQRDAGASAHRVGFADGYPFLITHEASLAALCDRLGEDLTMRRFRPNIVVRGGGAFEEDDWRRLETGAICFHLVKHCSRCVMTTVDPETGIMNEARQPLRELGRFRRTDAGILFGMNAVHDGPGRLTIGDTLHVTERATAS